MCSSLDGSHSRASTSTAAIVAHGTASRPSGSSRARTSSSLSARQSVQPSHTSPNVRPRSSRRRLRRTGIAVSGSSGRNRSGWSSSPVIARASARARARPAASSSPRWATVCWTTLRPTRTERTSRQYRWTLPSFRRVVCRRYIAQLIAQPRRRSQCTWSALHAVFDEARSTAARHTTGAAPAAALVTYSTAEVGLAQRGGEVALPHQVEIHPARRAPALGDGPHDEGLAALHVAGREDPGHVRHPVSVPPHIAAVGELHAEIGQEPFTPRPEKAHGEQHEVGRELVLGAGKRAEARTPTLGDHLDAHGVEGGDASVRSGEVGRVHRVLARPAFLVSRGDAKDIGPEGPGIAPRIPLFGRPGEDLELGDGARALTVGGAEAVGAGVASADDDDALVPGGDEVALRHHVALGAMILERQVVHGEMDAVEIPARDGQVARPLGAPGEDDGVELLAEPLHGQALAHVDAGLEADPRRLHEPEAPLEEALLHLEFGNAVAQEPAHAIGLLEHGHGMPRAIELLGGGESGRARADHGHLLSRAHLRCFRGHPALVEGVLDDADLDLLDGDGVIVDAEHAGALAGRGAEAARELREVVGGMETVDRLAPAVAVDEVVPVGDEVAQRAALMAEGDAAVHAARALLLQLLRLEGQVDLLPVVDPLRHGTPLWRLALDLEEAGDLAHPWFRP